jgi:hypothetical protein
MKQNETERWAERTERLSDYNIDEVALRQLQKNQAMMIQLLYYSALKGAWQLRFHFSIRKSYDPT